VILGYVYTAIPGHRLISIDGTEYQIADGYYRFDELITALNAAITASGWSAALNTDGIVTLSGPSAADILWPDRLGWVLGFGDSLLEPTITPAIITSRHISPAAIPTLAMTPTEVAVDNAEESVRDRHNRSHGYMFGSVRVWHWTITITAAAREAVETGWVRSGQVRVDAGDVTAIGPSHHTGALTGRVAGLALDWLGPPGLAAHADLRLTLATAV